MQSVGVRELKQRTSEILREVEERGQSFRTLKIRKSRGLAHSNQTRRFELTDNGIVLADNEGQIVQRSMPPETRGIQR